MLNKMAVVLRGICREDNRVFLVPVERRDTDTFIPVIVDKVAPGTTVVTLLEGIQ